MGGGDPIERPAGPGQIAGAQGCPRNESNVLSDAVVENARGAAVGEVVTVLDGGDITDPTCRSIWSTVT